ncbi:MAG: hypothetical protein JRD89_04510 [Deltaproteobacteria bacterium]|nr:hypothetical protein [Deltaproteobacteria bacterium]
MRTEIILRIVKLILADLIPWLKMEAKKTDTPIDDMAVEILARLLDLSTE